MFALKQPHSSVCLYLDEGEEEREREREVSVTSSDNVLMKLSVAFLHCTYDTMEFIGKRLSVKCQQLCASKWNILQLLGNGSDLFHSILVGSQVALKSFMFPQQSPELSQ